MVNYAGTEYYYLRNGQNDVVKLIDNSGDTVVEYIYDSWGRVVTTSGTLATTLGLDQPFRYRGYVYDTETGWYYLQSRYYSPETCRFISADVLLSTGQGVLGHNSFAYCGNNSLNRVDSAGQFWEELWGAFAQTIQQASGYFVVAAGVSQIDTPVPGPADVVAGFLLIGGVIACAVIATYRTITASAPAISIPRAEVREDSIAIPKDPDNSVPFPEDPNTFNPFGLVRVDRPGTKNGALISWMDPLTNIEVFRWDENPNYPDGPHYHIYGTGHYYAKNKDTVPEPLAEVYFPFR